MVEGQGMQCDSLFNIAATHAQKNDGISHVITNLITVI